VVFGTTRCAAIVSRETTGVNIFAVAWRQHGGANAAAMPQIATPNAGGRFPETNKGSAVSC